MPNTRAQFKTIEPKILYFGTPVALISSLNEDNSTNLAPMSSVWALGWTMVLGLLDETKTAENLERHPECVVNLPSPQIWRQVEALAPLTGKTPVPAIKSAQFRYEKDKFKASQLSELASDLIKPARVAECPFQLEARVLSIQRLGGQKLSALGGGLAASVEILRVHANPDFVVGDNYINPEAWSPLVYNFRHYYRLDEEPLGKTFRAER
jgi:flavin reductase (DIM6/NTAB) family NADH-FMN oxidoreductase RutF